MSDDSPDWAASLDEQLERLMEVASEEVRAGVAALLEGMRRFHAEGLGRLAALVEEDPSLRRRALEDPAIANLLLLYDLIDLDDAELADRAIEEVREVARSRGGDIELVDVAEGVVRVRLRGQGDAWTASLAALARSLSAALTRRLPGFAGIEVEEAAVKRRGEGWVADVGGLGQWVSFVPVENLQRAQARAERAREREAEAVGAARRAFAFDLAEARTGPGPLYGSIVDGFPLLLVDAGPGLVAFRDACPGSMLPLSLGSLTDGVIHCPWHGCSFDAATGSRVGGKGADLHGLRLEVAGTRGRVWVP